MLYACGIVHSAMRAGRQSVCYANRLHGVTWKRIKIKMNIIKGRKLSYDYFRVDEDGKRRKQSVRSIRSILM